MSGPGNLAGRTNRCRGEDTDSSPALTHCTEIEVLMTRCHAIIAFAALSLSLALSALGAAKMDDESRESSIAKGVVVERLTRGTEGERAGVRP